MTTIDASALAERMARISAKIENAARRVGRAPETVRLMAVSKGQPIGALQAVYDAGQRLFGESYVQEWQGKYPALPPDIEWHFIGGLQSNKARFLVEGPIRCVQSIDRPGLAEKLAVRHQGTSPVDVMVEVDVSGEASKGGVVAASLEGLINTIDRLPQLRLSGLMAIPAFSEDPEQVRPAFRAVREMRDALNRGRGTGREIEHLSMGMSHDFEVAIEEGATIIRVGTALFGPRQYR